jgi:hypothetical protein
MTTQVLNNKIVNLFKIIYNVLEDMKYHANSNTEKGNRYNYLKNIYINGVDKYYNKIISNTFDSYDFYDFQGNISYLKDFETYGELNEWILSGMSKKEQDEFFKSESDQPDSP